MIDARRLWRVRAFADHVAGGAWVYVVATDYRGALRNARRLYGVAPLGAECEPGPPIEDAWRARQWRVFEWLEKIKSRFAAST